MGAGSPALSLRHPPAPQRSWGGFCEEEAFVGTGLSLQQSGPPGLAMTVLSAGGERPRQGQAWGLLHPPFPCMWHRNAPAARGGASGSPRAVSTPGGRSQQHSVPWSPALGTNPPCCPGAGSGPAGPQPCCEEGEDGVTHGPAWGTTGSPASPAPSSRDIHGRALPGANNLHQTGRTGWFEPAASCQLRDRCPVLWGWFSGKTD